MATFGRKPVSRRQMLQAMRSNERAVMAAFLADIRGKKVLIKDVEAAINDNQKLYELLELTGGDMATTNEAIRAAMVSGGELDGSFNPNSEAATNFILNGSSKRITEINEEMRESVRIVLASARTLGESTSTTALDIVGRISQSGRREGGIIGLNAPQTAAVRHARENLVSGDPELMRKYLQLERRDRRFDGFVERAIADGRPVSKRDLDRIVARYEDRLLVTRGETIARTETIEALGAGRNEAARQALDEGALGAGLTIVKEWQAGGGARDTHAELSGTIVPFDQPFEFAGGSLAMFPGDTSLGAPAKEIINCRCTVIQRVVEAQ